MSRVEKALQRAEQLARERRDAGDGGRDRDADNAVRLFVSRPGSAVADIDRFPDEGADPAPREEVDRPAIAGSGTASPRALCGGFDETVAEKLVVTSGTKTTSVEQYRKLAATLHHTQGDRGIKVVMVASALAGEGKTLTATNLALTFSESYRRRVLLIDADLRRPMLHDIFQVPNVAGLNEGLKSEADLKLSVIEVSSNLSVLTAGRPDPDPMSGLTSDRMRRVIAEAAARFDWVILDTPPIALMPDANLLAAMADVALLVVQASVTPFRQIQRAIEAIGRDRIAGVVLNRADETIVSPEYTYYRYYGRDLRGKA